MPSALLDAVECDFKNYRRFDEAKPAEILDGMLFEELGHLLNLDVGESGVCFADVQQLAVVLHSERIVGKHIATPAMPEFDTGYNDVQGCECLFPFQPAHAALPWKVS